MTLPEPCLFNARPHREEPGAVEVFVTPKSYFDRTGFMLDTWDSCYEPLVVAPLNLQELAESVFETTEMDVSTARALLLAAGYQEDPAFTALINKSFY